MLCRRQTFLSGNGDNFLVTSPVMYLKVFYGFLDIHPKLILHEFLLKFIDFTQLLQLIVVSSPGSLSIVFSSN